MSYRSKYLTDLAKKYIQEWEKPVLYASLHGSVARGEADQYSDADLTVYLEGEASAYSMDTYYQGEILQLHIQGGKELPLQEEITANPWDYRFFIETVIITDSAHHYQELTDWAKSYLLSDQGKQQMIKQVKSIVEERSQTAYAFSEQGFDYAAHIAAAGAWTEAAFLLLFLEKHSVATGALLPFMEEQYDLTAFQQIISVPGELTPAKISLVLREYRDFLRAAGYNHYELADLHHGLCEQKIKRLSDKRQYFHTYWQMSGEALGLYFATSRGKVLDHYLSELPSSLQQNLTTSLFLPLKQRQVQALNKLSKKLIEKAIV